MLLRNLTPLTPMSFDAIDKDEQERGVFILRGAFAIDADRPLRLLPEQPLVNYADRHYGQANQSSVSMESELAPFKPNADIILNATARSPGGKPAPGWLVSARIGKLAKTVRVTGPRYWIHQFPFGWALTDPQPCLETPLRYEYAYGGLQTLNGQPFFSEFNPVGCGFVEPGTIRKLDKEKPIPAPRIESPHNPVQKLGQDYLLEGFGTIGRAWLPRRTLAGTYDDQWKQERHPQLPEDFAYAYYNCAHPDLIYPGYLKGDEQVELRGIHPDQPLRFSLPAYQPHIVLEYPDATQKKIGLNLDTLHIDTDQQQVQLVWRAWFKQTAPLAAIHALVKMPQQEVPI